MSRKGYQGAGSMGFTSGGSRGGSSSSYDRGYNYGGSNSYYGSRGRSRYSYGTYNWNWSSFGTEVEEDNSGLFVKEHEGYSTPKNRDFTKDLPYGYGYSEDNKKLVKELSRFFFYKMIDEKEFMDDKFKDESSLSESEMETKSSKESFYENLWDKYVPGISPLDKAMSLIKEITRKKLQNGDNSTVITDKDLDDAEVIEFRKEIYNDPTFDEFLDMECFKKKNMKKENILHKISLFADFGDEFKVEKEIDEKQVPNSELISKRMMTEYSQLKDIELYQRMLPHFKAKLATKNLSISVPVDRTEHKQKIIILLDYSGSMEEREKQEWVLAVLLDRLRYVIKEEAEIFFSYFVYSKGSLKFQHIKDRESAIQFWQTFSTNPDGGGTDINGIVNYVGHQITNEKKLHNLDVDLSQEQPEILIINDGQDRVSDNNFNYKTNALTLMEENEGLRKLCMNKDGKYVYISYSDEITTWNKEGKTVIK